MTDVEERFSGNGDDGSLIERQLFSRASDDNPAVSKPLWYLSSVLPSLTIIPAGGRGGFDMVGQLATEHRKQAVGMSDCAADRRRVGAVGDVEVRTLNEQSGDPEIPVMS